MSRWSLKPLHSSGLTWNSEGNSIKTDNGVEATWQMLAVGHLPLQSDRLRSAVDAASEGRRLPDAHHGAVGLDGDDGALETCGRAHVQDTSVLGK